jgi:hypothetical protein
LSEHVKRPPMHLVMWFDSCSGAEEGSDESFLLRCLDRFSAVAGPDPCDGVAGRVPGQSRQAGQRRSCPAMTAKASHLDVLPRPGPLQNSTERPGNSVGIGRHAEIRPVDVAVLPWRLPAGVEVQAIVRDAGAHVRASWIKGRRRQPRAVGQHNRVQVTVNLEHAMLVIAVAAPGRLRASVPVQPALSAGHDTANLDHGTTIAANCQTNRPGEPPRLMWPIARSLRTRGHGRTGICAPGSTAS